MIVVEHLTIDGTPFTRTYSDEGRYVVREGISYDEAFDPAEYGRTYTEGELIPVDPDEAIRSELQEATEIVDILLGGSE